MTSQINLSFPNKLLEETKEYAKSNGYLNVQELIRDLIRDKLDEELEVREEYIEKLKSKEANTFYSIEESKKVMDKLKKRAKLE